MSEGDATAPRGASTWSHMLWSGRGKPATRWRSLVGGAMALVLAWICYTLAISSIRWAMPLKLIGWAMLLITLALLFLGGRALLRLVLHMGIKRLLIRLGILYVLSIALVALLVPSGQTGVNHVISSAGTIFAWVANGLGALGATAIDAPSDVGFAATGKRSPVRVPGVDWVGDIPPTPILVTIGASGAADAPMVPDPTVPAIQTATDGPLHLGDTVRVVNTARQGLRVRDIPSREGKILAKFAEGSSLQIIEGPKQADGYTWWKIRGDAGEGWCAADFLAREP